MIYGVRIAYNSGRDGIDWESAKGVISGVEMLSILIWGWVYKCINFACSTSFKWNCARCNLWSQKSKLYLQYGYSAGYICEKSSGCELKTVYFMYLKCVFIF